MSRTPRQAHAHLRFQLGRRVLGKRFLQAPPVPELPERRAVGRRGT
ncbi:hypothetical protein [Streptomyces sp. CA-210063]|nr:hypothetical protein [Streptomyces sp. CA-210063]